MSEIKRYFNAYAINDLMFPEDTYESESGLFVHYTDYEALKKENQILKEALDIYEKQSPPMLNDIKIAFEALQKREAEYKRWALILGAMLGRAAKKMSQEDADSLGIQKCLAELAGKFSEAALKENS